MWVFFLITTIGFGYTSVSREVIIVHSECSENRKDR